MAGRSQYGNGRTSFFGLGLDGNSQDGSSSDYQPSLPFLPYRPVERETGSGYRWRSGNVLACGLCTSLVVRINRPERNLNDRIGLGKRGLFIPILYSKMSQSWTTVVELRWDSINLGIPVNLVVKLWDNSGLERVMSPAGFMMGEGVAFHLSCGTVWLE